MGNFGVSVWHHLKENNSSETAMNEKQKTKKNKQQQMLKTEIKEVGK